jgi:predicted small integral membrane protein
VKNLGKALTVIGFLFLLNAIFGRYIVLPGYFQSLEEGISANSIPVDVPILKVLRYLLWAFSFKFGIYFILLGFLFQNHRSFKDRLLFSLLGLAYISMAYMDLPFNYSLFFGIGGSIITVSAIGILWATTKEQKNVYKNSLLADFGYFFLIMAAYNLCPFLGVKCFALQPEQMIKYGLQSTAVSFANHILIELVLGFGLMAIYHLRNSINKENR